MAVADRIKHLVAIWFLCPPCCFFGAELSQTAPSHVDTGACLHNVRLTLTENAAVFCSARKNAGVIAACIAFWVYLALLCNPTKGFVMVLLYLPLEMLPCNAAELAG